MTVLCATHFSEAAQRATTAAAQLARKLDQPLFLVHVLSGDLSRALGTSLHESASAALQQEVRRLEALGARVSHQLLTGEAAEELARFAKEKGAGLVVTSRAFVERGFVPPGTRRYKDRRFIFDRVFRHDTSPAEVYESTARPRTITEDPVGWV